MTDFIKSTRPQIGVNVDDYIIITHNQPEIKTFGELFAGNVILLEDITPERLINYKSKYTDPVTTILDASQVNAFVGEWEVTNRQRIFQKYTKEEKEQHKTTPIRQLPLKVGTRLAIPKDRIVQESLFQQDFQTNKYYEVKPFLSERLTELLRDVRYVRSIGNNKAIIPNLTVFIWVRSINKILNVSPFVENIQTNSTMEGSSFNFRLAPILGTFDSQLGEWRINESSISSYYYGGVRNDYLAKSYISRDTHFGKKVRPYYFFHQVIAPNDLVFIRFETLDIEKEQRIEQSQSFEVNYNQLPNNIYDMIGLVDANVVSMVSSTTDITIDISGRDVTKLIIDDGTLFFPLEYSQGVIYNAGQREREEGKLLSRLFTSGELTSLNAYMYRSIDFSMKFVMNQLSTTGIIPNEVFKHFRNKSNRFRLQKTETQSEKLKRGIPTSEPAEGLWQIVNLIVDPSVTERRIADSSITSEQGSLINFINKICQKPFVEFYTDTYQDKFYFIVRQPPFDKVKYTGLIYDQIQVEDKKVVNESQSVTFNQEEVDTLTTREFREDTGQPELANLLPGFVVTGTEEESVKTHTESRISDILLTIRDEDVLAETLGFTDSEVYSWYQINPQTLFFGDDLVTLYHFPVIFFPEYQEIYGAKPYSVTSIYHIYEAYRDKTSPIKLNTLEQQTFYDLKYMIESTAYLPFVRQGSITINGDRRIKKGTCIYYEPTSEVYYVTGVIHTYNINASNIERFTVLQVERGMVHDYILGKNETINDEPVFVSYFNIINTEINDDIFVNSTNKSETEIIQDEALSEEERDEQLASVRGQKEHRFSSAIKDWQVNKKVFDFFKNRRQYRF